MLIRFGGMAGGRPGEILFKCHKNKALCKVLVRGQFVLRLGKFIMLFICSGEVYGLKRC